MSIPAWVPLTISSLSVCIALCGFIWQIRRARFNQSIDLLFKLEADFFGPAKRIQRVKASRDLLRGEILEAEPILDFFETMALLLRRGALDREIVKHTFFYWIDNYYQAAEEQVAARQHRNPLVWKDLTRLVTELRQIQSTQLAPAPYQPPTPQQTIDFLREEETEA